MRIISLIFVVLCVSLLTGASFGEKEPNLNELELAFRNRLPDSFQLKKFDIEVSENLGNKVDPKWIGRYKAVLATKVPFYKHDKDENGFKFIIIQNDIGTEVDVYGKVTSVVYQGKWSHNWSMDGNPLRSLGDQRDEFKGEKVIVRGSENEKNYHVQQEQKNIAADKKKAEYKEMLLKAQSLMVGTWRRNDTTSTFFSDGTSLSTGLYEERRFNWHIEGNYLIVQETGLRRNAKNEPWRDTSKNNSPLKYEIVSINEKNRIVKFNNQEFISERIK
ncbi:MAG: hypothetical protein V2A69_06995 [Pseudomonadota bacterium]